MGKSIERLGGENNQSLHEALMPAYELERLSGIISNSLAAAVTARNELNNRVDRLNTSFIERFGSRISIEANEAFIETEGREPVRLSAHSLKFKMIKAAGMFSGLTIFDRASLPAQEEVSSSRYPYDTDRIEVCMIIDPDPQSRHPNKVEQRHLVPIRQMVDSIVEYDMPPSQLIL